MVEIPESVTQRFGQAGEGLFKQGYKQGNLDGKKVAQDQLAIEMNSVVNGVVNAKKKDGYQPKTVDDVAKLVGQTFALGKPLPDRNGVKKLITAFIHALDAMPKPEPKPKPQPSTS